MDWSARVFHASTVGKYGEALQKLASTEDETDIISIMELLAFVVLACHQRSRWDGELVLYVTDNANVRSWLHKRSPGNRVASLLVRLVQRLEAEANFTVHPVYIRTYRNQLADWLSRADLGEVRAQLHSEGWEETSEDIRWDQFLLDAGRSALAFPVGEDVSAQKARQLTHQFGPPTRALTQICFAGVVGGAAC